MEHVNLTLPGNAEPLDLKGYEEFHKTMGPEVTGDASIEDLVRKFTA